MPAHPSSNGMAIGGASPTRAQSSYRAIEIAPKGVIKLASGTGLAYYPNWKLRQAKLAVHQLNLMIVGQPGVGRSTLINTLFNCPIVPTERTRKARWAAEGEVTTNVHPFELAQHVKVVEECGVRLRVEINEVLGFDGPTCIEDRDWRQKLLGLLTERYMEKNSHKNAIDRQQKKDHDSLIHAVLYCISPTFNGFTMAEIDLFREIQRQSLLIPLIVKADMYTVPELERLKNQIRRAFKENSLDALPDMAAAFQDEWVMREMGEIKEHWPFATIGATSIVKSKEGEPIRARAYSWGVINVDDEQSSDLIHLGQLLVRSFFILSHRYINETLYERGWKLQEGERREGNYVLYANGRTEVTTLQQRSIKHQPLFIRPISSSECIPPVLPINSLLDQMDSKSKVPLSGTHLMETEEVKEELPIKTMPIAQSQDDLYKANHSSSSHASFTTPQHEDPICPSYSSHPIISLEESGHFPSVQATRSLFESRKSSEASA